MKFQHGTQITPRAVSSPVVQNVELDPNTKYQLAAIARVEKMLARIARKISDVTRPVDEYSIVGVSAASAAVSTVEVLPQYDGINELIESILVTGPVSTAFTLQLGDRELSLTTDTRGYAILAPVGMMLSRNDRRVLTSATSGAWTLELMGHADERY